MSSGYIIQYNCIVAYAPLFWLTFSCRQKVRATKRFSVHRAPLVLTIQLKRYSATEESKVAHHIQFYDRLNLREFMSNTGGQQVSYLLHGVLVHSGCSTSSGHYYSYVRGTNGVWYCMNDSAVTEVRLERVLGAQAYLLFYVQMRPTTNMATVLKVGFMSVVPCCN